MSKVIYESEFSVTDIHEFKGKLTIEKYSKNSDSSYRLSMHNGFKKDFKSLKEILILIKDESKRTGNINNITHKGVSNWLSQIFKEVSLL